jgi:hypothetical protein
MSKIIREANDSRQDTREGQGTGSSGRKAESQEGTRCQQCLYRTTNSLLRNVSLIHSLSRVQGEASKSSHSRTRRDSDASVSSSSEDGEYSERNDEPHSKQNKHGYDDKDEDGDSGDLTLEDLSKARITRDMLSKYCHLPRFDGFVQGAQNYVCTSVCGCRQLVSIIGGWVRYAVQADAKGVLYSLCEIESKWNNVISRFPRCATFICSISLRACAQPRRSLFFRQYSDQQTT